MYRKQHFFNTLKIKKVLRKTLKGLSAAYKYVTPGGARKNPSIEVLQKTLSKGYSKNPLEGLSKEPILKGFLKNPFKGFSKEPLQRVF